MSLPFLAVFTVCFLASLLGPLCGIGGGVIIKPVVDALGIMSVASVSFLSSISVLTMALSTLLQDAVTGRSTVDARELLPLALGSAVGGVSGKALFNGMSNSFPDADTVGAAQALVLFALSVLVLVYTLNKNRIRGLRIEAAAPKVEVGFVAGACWSFLGIGGGPFNLAILTFFFSMESKPAAKASLFIIAFSQTASFAYTLATGSVPSIAVAAIVGACAAAVAGSVVGGRLARKIDSATVDRLYLASLVLIIGICCYNVVRFTAAV